MTATAGSVPTAPATSRLRRMLEARSVAVVGASQRPGSVGEQALAQLVAGGFAGAVFPVNPRYDAVLDLPCVPTLADIAAPVDLVILAVGNTQLEEQLRQTIAIGAGAAVVFASGHDVPLERLQRAAREAELEICGGNGMGFVHLEQHLRATGYAQPLDLEPGPVTLLTHSGSLFTAMLHNRRRLRFNLAVSAGQELVTTVADYLTYALDRPSTRVVVLFLETMRDPGQFVTGLRIAQQRDIAVVALTVGRHAETKALVTAHSGALAGADGAYEAVFDAFGVHRVRTLDEMLDTVELFCGHRRAAPGGVAALHDSGGERAHLLDLALDAGIRLAEPSDGTRATLAELLQPGLPAVNPLDAWGSSRDYEQTFLSCGQALLDDPDTAGLLFCVDLADQEGVDSYSQIARQLFATTDKPVAVLSNVPGAINDVVADRLRAGGLAVLEGTANGLAAFGHLMAHRDHGARPPVICDPAIDEQMVERWRTRLTAGATWSEANGLALLRDFGIPVVKHAVVDSEDAAISAAADLGWPVVAKTAAAGFAHKSDAGGVHLGITAEDTLRAAYRQLAATFGPDVTVARQVPAGVELALGVIADPDFGPLVVVGAGGVLVELLADRRVALPPLDTLRAHRLVDGLVLRPLLRGVRGLPAADVNALCDTIVALSVLAVTLGERLAAVDVNPLICGPDGCVAVDALVVPA